MRFVRQSTACVTLGEEQELAWLLSAEECSLPEAEVHWVPLRGTEGLVRHWARYR